MRIAIVAPLVTPIAEPQLGGSQAIVADLAVALTARGHDVDVFAAKGSRIDGANVVDTGVDSRDLASSLYRASANGHRSTTAARRAFASVYERVTGYDVVHNHAFDAPAVAQPAVHTLHLGPDREVAEALHPASTVVCVSESQRRAWSRLVRVDAVIRNGVPIEKIPWSAAGGPNALYAGRLSPEKGAAEAIEIARRAGVEIVVVGDAYDELYAAALHERFPDADFRPGMPRPDLWRLMAESRALLCPIAWDEPFGLAAAEAQAAGTPVVGFNRGALSEVVDDGTTGALVDDVVQGAEALLRTFDRSACRAHAERTLSLDVMVAAYEDIYRRAAVAT